MDLSPKDLENRLLSCIADTEDVQRCERAGITNESFRTTEPDHGAAWKYIVKHAYEHGRPPAEQDLRTLLGFEGTGPGDLTTYVAEIRRREIRFKAREVLLRRVGGLAEDSREDPVEVLGKTTAELGELQVAAGRHITYYDRNALDRLALFDEARRRIDEEGIIGVPTGLRPFDAGQRGLYPGEVLIIAGSTGVGKSWLAGFICSVAYQAGKRILIISPELTAEEQSIRLDALLAARRQVRLSSYDISVGRAERAEYENWLTSLIGEQRLLIVDASDTGGPFTFQDTWRLTLEHRPDVLVVDGLHLLSGVDETQKGWEVLKEGIAHLKSLAQKERIVIICAHQVQRAAAARKWESIPPTLGQISYGFAVAETADHVLTMSRSAGNELERLYRVVKTRGIRGNVDLLRLHWDVDCGSIHDKGGVVRSSTSYDELPGGEDEGV